MNIKQAESFLKLHWEISRKSWINKFLTLGYNSPRVNVSINGVISEYTPTEEDFYADDWELYKEQKEFLPTLTE
jgi:hypothetical protein